MNGFKGVILNPPKALPLYLNVLLVAVTQHPSQGPTQLPPYSRHSPEGH